jgi:hypothetical protein
MVEGDAVHATDGTLWLRWSAVSDKANAFCISGDGHRADLCPEGVDTHGLERKAAALCATIEALFRTNRFFPRTSMKAAVKQAEDGACRWRS